jgi:hypothetical protein
MTDLDRLLLAVEQLTRRLAASSRTRKPFTVPRPQVNLRPLSIAARHA